jgi:predicted Zn-dependent peptidase
VYRGELRTVDDELKAWDAVTLADVRRVLDEFPLTNTITTAFGPLESLK